MSSDTYVKLNENVFPNYFDIWLLTRYLDDVHRVCMCCVTARYIQKQDLSSTSDILTNLYSEIILTFAKGFAAFCN